MHIRLNIHACTHAHTHAYARARTHTHTHIHVHTHTHNTHEIQNTHTHTHTHKTYTQNIRIFIHAHTHIHIHTSKSQHGPYTQLIHTYIHTYNSMIHGICESPVNEAYIEYLTKLKKKFEYSETKEAKQTTSISTIQPELEKLRTKAIERVREFLLLKIYSLGKPKTNFQILQQSVLLKYRYLIEFLRDHGKVRLCFVCVNAPLCVYVCVYVRVCTYIHICMYVCICLYEYTYIYM